MHAHCIIASQHCIITILEYLLYVDLCREYQCCIIAIPTLDFDLGKGEGVNILGGRGANFGGESRTFLCPFLGHFCDGREGLDRGSANMLLRS